MEVELKSKWQDTNVELLKSLHGYELANINEEDGFIDYVIRDDEKNKLLRVAVGPKLYASRADADLTAKTLEAVEAGRYDEAIILASDLTEASWRMVDQEDNLESISAGKRCFKLDELIKAVQNKTRELCEARCGRYPSNIEECEGYGDRKYRCEVRRLSDDADFHAERGWHALLMKDFSKLVTLQRKSNS